MAASDWGMCKDCEWWQIDPGVNIADNTMGLCTEEELQPFRLRVSGNSGCNPGWLTKVRCALPRSSARFILSLGQPFSKEGRHGRHTSSL
jgi:hypothetical protein